MTDGWDDSAAAWIADMGELGDFSRAAVLDEPMLARVRGRCFSRALDVGCGEGRFCRMLAACGIRAVGIDPTQALLDAARARDPQGDYRTGRAEALDFPDGSFDLVVSYLTFIDIADIETAIAEMVRVLRPGSTLLIANLNGFATAVVGGGWQNDAQGEPRFSIDHYLDERAEWVSWRGIRIVNWHRPLSRYMSLLLAQGLVLRHFDEPAPQAQHAASPAGVAYRRVPHHLLMEWEKPPA